ncbi:MAG: COX15/CtaA family protein [Aquabacterium sp.]
MDIASLIDLDPVLELLVLGGALALIPAAVVAWRARRQGVRGWRAWQRVLTVATLFLTLDLVVFGAFTRLTDSGLGCPDWPGCYGATTPWGARSAISEAQAARPTGPVTHHKAWIEMGHRYLATAVGALITGLMVAAWRARRQPGALSPWWPTVTFLWVCVQGAFGALTVTMKLQPIIVTLHLLGALLGVGLLTAQVRALHEPGSLYERAVIKAWRGSPWRRAGVLVLALVAVQVALGGWVSSNYAVLACPDFPTCQGQWWPDMDAHTGFTVWRPLGQDGQGGWIALPALTAIHMAHRLMAVVALLALLFYGMGLVRHTAWQREGRVVIGLGAWQLLTGLSNVVFSWPLLSALAHTLGAALLVWWLVRLLVVPDWAAEGAPVRHGYKGLHATSRLQRAP